MAAQKSKVFVVRANVEAAAKVGSRFVLDGETVRARLVRAKNQSQVETHLAQDVSIDVATPDELHALGKEGIDIEDAAE